MNKRLTRKEWLRKRKIQKFIRLSIVTLTGAAMLSLLIFAIGRIYQTLHADGSGAVIQDADKPEIMEAFLTPNEYSRPGDALPQVNGIVVHYTANPKTTGWNNRDYFESLKDTHETKVSSHFIIGLDGTIIQCIPLDEIAYASNERNSDTISIECCHPGKSGKFTKETYESLVKLTRWLAFFYRLEEESIIRHYDIKGKICPKYFVDHEDKWTEFKKEVFQTAEK